MGWGVVGRCGVGRCGVGIAVGSLFAHLNRCDTRPLVQERRHLLPQRRDVPRLQRGRHRGLRRTDRPAAVPGRSRDHLHLAAALLRLAEQRRRLRRVGLLRRASENGNVRRVCRVHEPGAAARLESDRRSRRQSHVESASVVQGGETRSRLTLPQLLRVVEAASAGLEPWDGVSGRAADDVDARSRRGPLLPASLLRLSARPQHPRIRR